MSILEKLEKELNEKKIPAKLIEEGKVLSLYLDEKFAGTETYGDIYFRPFSEAEGSGGYWYERWEVADVKDLSDEERGDLCAACAMINPALPVAHKPLYTLPYSHQRS